DRENGMIKCFDVSGSFRGNRSPLRVDDDIVGIDADFVQHGTHQRDLVLAVSVVVRKYVCGGMWLQTTNSKFDGYVANVVLDEIGQDSHFVEGPWRRSSQGRDFLLDFGRCVQSASNQAFVPRSHLAPIAEYL